MSPTEGVWYLRHTPLLLPAFLNSAGSTDSTHRSEGSGATAGHGVRMPAHRLHLLGHSAVAVGLLVSPLPVLACSCVFHSLDSIAKDTAVLTVT